MSSFKFYCSKCGQRLEAQDEWRGRKVQCPSCNAVIAIPEEEENQSEFEATPSSPTQNPPEPSFDKTFLWISGSFILLFIVLASALVIAISLSSEGNNTTTNITNTTTRQQYTPQPETQKESEEDIDPRSLKAMFAAQDAERKEFEKAMAEVDRKSDRVFTSEEEFMNCPDPNSYNAETCSKSIAKRFKDKYANDPILTQYDPLVKKTYVAPAGARFFLVPNYNSRIEFRDFPDGKLRLYPENCLPKHVFKEFERTDKAIASLKEKQRVLKAQNASEEELEKIKIQILFYVKLNRKICDILFDDMNKKGVFTRRNSGSWVLTEELKPGRYFVAFESEYEPGEAWNEEIYRCKDIEKTDKVLIVNFSELKKTTLKNL